MNVLQNFSTRRALILAAGTLVVGTMAAMVTLACRCKAPTSAAVERWVLDADRVDNCYYGSAWNDGDVIMPRGAHDQPVRFVHPYHWEDDCTWRGVETLTPDGQGGYKYHYEDVLVSCPEDAVPAPQCPLDGTVRVIPVM